MVQPALSVADQVRGGLDHKSLQLRLQALVKAHEEDLAKAASLELRIATLLERHATKVCMSRFPVIITSNRYRSMPYRNCLWRGTM